MNWLQAHKEECRRRPEPASKKFSDERIFRAHVLQKLDGCGYRLLIERGLELSPGLKLRWDVGLQVREPGWNCCDLIIEFKVKAGMASMQRALGQCILYHECRCAEVVILCLPSDLKVPSLFLRVCNRLEILTATENDILDQVVEGLKGGAQSSSICVDTNRQKTTKHDNYGGFDPLEGVGGKESIRRHHPR